MKKEIIIFLLIAFSILFYHYALIFNFDSQNFLNILFKFHLYVNLPYLKINIFIFILIIYLLIYMSKKVLSYLFKNNNINDDINFVHSLHAQANANINPYIYVTLGTIVLFFISAITWASWAKVDELARGEGRVIPSKKIQTIQSLDGGIISEILIREGSIIKKGQALMKIDTIRFQASLEENTNVLENLIATKTRLEIESKLDFNKSLLKLKFSNVLIKNHTEIIQFQRNIYKTRYKQIKSEIQTISTQKLQKEQELLEVEQKIKNVSESIKLIKEELKTVKQLVTKKAKANIDLLILKREYSRINGEYYASKLAIPRVKLSITESENKIDEKISIFKSEVAKELQKVNSDIKIYQSKIISDNDKLDKTLILSPVNGIIKLINFNTIGGVIRSGENLIEIVPESEILLVEAKIDPKDIAFINPDQSAIVKITAYDFSIYGGLEAKIIEISADSIKDEDSRDGKTYYKVTLQTNKNYLEKNGERLSIIPGMITSVDIITGKKTILDFLLKPILKTKNSAFHER